MKGFHVMLSMQNDPSLVLKLRRLLSNFGHYVMCRSIASDLSERSLVELDVSLNIISELYSLLGTHRVHGRSERDYNNKSRTCALGNAPTSCRQVDKIHNFQEPDLIVF